MKRAILAAAALAVAIVVAGCACGRGNSRGLPLDAACVGGELAAEPVVTGLTIPGGAPM